jgi:hypothetical protein
MRETCPRCGSAKIIPAVPLLDHYGDTGTMSDPAEVQVHAAPQAWVFKDTVTGTLSLRICGECGYAELQVSNFRELYEKYMKSCGTPIPEEAACLSCGKPIPEEATVCPACGWVWGAEQGTQGDRPRD